MDQLETALSNARTVATTKLSDLEKNAALMKIETLHKVLKQSGLHAFLEYQECTQLAIDINCDVRAVNIGKMDPVTCCLNAINSVKQKFLAAKKKQEQKVSQSNVITVPVAQPVVSSTTSTPPSTAQPQVPPPSKPVHYNLKMPAFGIEDAIEIGDDDDDEPQTSKTGKKSTSPDDFGPVKKRIKTTRVFKSESETSESEFKSDSDDSNYEEETVDTFAESTDFEQPGPSSAFTGQSVRRNTRKSRTVLSETEDDIASATASSTTAASNDLEGRPKRRAAPKNLCENANGKPPDPETMALKKAAALNKKEIEKSERFLKKLHDKIVDLQGRELSYDEMESVDSPYIMIDKLERKFMKVMEYLSKKNGERRLFLGRPVERVLSYNQAEYPEVNDEINMLLRKRKFPDYVDILNCVKRASINSQLGLHRNVVEAEAKRAFSAIGRHLKKQRQRDLRKTFGSTFTDQAHPGNDPALVNPELAEKLKRQKEEGDQRMSEIMDRYARLQEEQASETQKEADAEEEEEDDINDSGSVAEEDDDDEDADENDEEAGEGEEGESSENFVDAETGGDELLMAEIDMENSEEEVVEKISSTEPCGPTPDYNDDVPLIVVDLDEPELVRLAAVRSRPNFEDDNYDDDLTPAPDEAIALD